jgi:hypothetical protein
MFCVYFSKAQIGTYASMGDASVMLPDFWSVFGNQAGLAKIEEPTAGLAYYNQFLVWQTGTQTGAFVLPTQTGNFALSFKRYGYTLYSENNVGLAFARNLGEYISASVQFDYLFYHQSEDYGNRGAFLFETGLIATPTDNFYIGVHVYNPGRAKLADFEDERIATKMRFGLGYRFNEFVLFTAETEKELENKVRFKSGIEYQALARLYLRTGLMTQPSQFTAGLGYHINNFTTDIIFISHESLPVSSQIAITYKF